MSNNKGVDATLMTRELLKWRRTQTHEWITTIMVQAINQGFLEYWLMNWIKSTIKEEIKIWYPTIELS